MGWLWSQQGGDGRFGSAVYGFLAGGESLTPFVITSLVAVPTALVPLREDAAHRALDFLRTVRGPDGSVGLAGVAPDYPTYATAMTISAFAALRPEGWRATIEPSVTWLESQQLRADRWADHAAQGGFGMGSRVARLPPHSGHVDLSMTRRATEALATIGRPPAEARDFVARCVAPDGGFVYTPVEPALNKGARVDGHSQGYGTATADGLLTLLALGAGPTDPLVAGALRRLHALHDPTQHPGVGDGAYRGYADAMKGYYRAAAAGVFRRLGGPAGWREALVGAVCAEQLPDGSWRNPVPAQKEDDPLIATAFAVQALAAASG